MFANSLVCLSFNKRVYGLFIEVIVVGYLYYCIEYKSSVKESNIIIQIATINQFNKQAIHFLISRKRNQRILEQIYPCGKNKQINEDFAKLTYFGSILQRKEMISKKQPINVHYPATSKKWKFWKLLKSMELG